MINKRFYLNGWYGKAVGVVINRRIDALYKHLYINGLDKRWLIQEEQAVDWIMDTAEYEVELEFRGIPVNTKKSEFKSFLNKLKNKKTSDVDDWFPGFYSILDLKSDGVLRLNA